MGLICGLALELGRFVLPNLSIEPANLDNLLE